GKGSRAVVEGPPRDESTRSHSISDFIANRIRHELKANSATTRNGDDEREEHMHLYNLRISSFRCTWLRPTCVVEAWPRIMGAAFRCRPTARDPDRVPQA